MRALISTLALMLLAACGGSGGNGPNGNTMRGDYPAGPYGITEGTVIEPLTFIRPDGSPRSLADVWKDDTKTLLLVITSSGWCTACIEEQPDLERFHDTYGPRGLSIIETLFEDASFNPATPALAEQWIRQYSVSFEVVADPEFKLGRYYNRDLTPMNLIVDVTKMQILRISTGADPTALEAIFEARLR